MAGPWRTTISKKVRESRHHLRTGHQLFCRSLPDALPGNIWVVGAFLLWPAMSLVGVFCTVEGPCFSAEKRIFEDLSKLRSAVCPATVVDNVCAVRAATLGVHFVHFLVFRANFER